MAAILNFPFCDHEMGLIRFLDMNNIYLDTQIMLIEIFTCMIQNVFAAVILKFGGNHCSEILVPAIFEFSILENPQVYKFSCFFPKVHDMSENDT